MVGHTGVMEAAEKAVMTVDECSKKVIDAILAKGGNVIPVSYTHLQAFVDAEDKRKPLSDQKIVEMLKEQGVDVARRTIAKYREALNILPSSKRKQFR